MSKTTAVKIKVPSKGAVGKAPGGSKDKGIMKIGKK